jgi:hypothetical protein
VSRTLVVMEDYLVDRIEWEGQGEHELALPWHGVSVLDSDGSPLAGDPAELNGGAEREDGFRFLTYTARLEPLGVPARLAGDLERPTPVAMLAGWVVTSEPATWWTAVAPGAPGREARRMVLVRSAARCGSITAVWSWRGRVRSAELTPDTVRVLREDGSEHVHSAVGGGWRVESSVEPRVVELGAGAADDGSAAGSLVDSQRSLSDAPERRTARTLPGRFTLGAEHYRRSEESWEEAGRPTATVSLERSGDRLHVRVDVPRAARRFVDVGAENPLDNDPVAIHGDGVQLYVEAGTMTAGWLLVPVSGSTDVGWRVAEGWSDALPLDARWQASADGYVLSVVVTLSSGVREVGVDVIVNEIGLDRTRRRGQLVLSGAHGEFVYLRADRHDRDRLLRFV